MTYFYVKRKTKQKEEKVGNYIFTNGVLAVENSIDAAKMSNNLTKYYGAKMSNKSPKELSKNKLSEELDN
jgi:hypothetical protein